jgi:hypothetical protein
MKTNDIKGRKGKVEKKRHITACKIKPLVLLKFESSDFSFKFVLGLQFSAWFRGLRLHANR